MARRIAVLAFSWSVLISFWGFGHLWLEAGRSAGTETVASGREQSATAPSVGPENPLPALGPGWQRLGEAEHRPEPAESQEASHHGPSGPSPAAGIQLCGTVQSERSEPIEDFTLALTFHRERALREGPRQSFFQSGGSFDWWVPLQEPTAKVSLRLQADGWVGEVLGPFVVNDREVRHDLSFRLRPSVPCLSGIVRNSRGDPLAGASVQVLHGALGSQSVLRTAKDGTFLLRGAAEHPIQEILISHPTCAPLRYPQHGQPAPQDWLELRLVCVEPAKVRGRVVDGLARPWASCRIIAWWRGKGVGFGDLWFQATLTTASGHYELGGLPEGTVWLARGPRESDTALMRQDARQLHLKGGAEHFEEFVVPGNCSVRGRVDLDQDDVALRLSLLPRWQDCLHDPLESSSEPDEHGGFVFDGLSARQYLLRVHVGPDVYVERPVDLWQKNADLGTLQLTMAEFHRAFDERLEKELK